jgi:hypothetical protein
VFSLPDGRSSSRRPSRVDFGTAWDVEHGFAVVCGIAIRFFTIQPMRGLHHQALVHAIRTNALSPAFSHVEMHGFMAIAQFGAFGSILHFVLKTDAAAFWPMVQLATLTGFVTSHAVNW